MRNAATLKVFFVLQKESYCFRLLNCWQDKQVNELAQELAVHLGLKNRKPYISTKVRSLILFSLYH